MLGGRRCITRGRRDDKSLSGFQQPVSDGGYPERRRNAGCDPPRSSSVAVLPVAYRYLMNILNTDGLTAEQAEALFNHANTGVLTRIDERGKRCEELYQRGLLAV
jgi:hypothetical protein